MVMPKSQKMPVRESKPVPALPGHLPGMLVLHNTNGLFVSTNCPIAVTADLNSTASVFQLDFEFKSRRLQKSDFLFKSHPRLTHLGRTSCLFGPGEREPV